MQTVFKILYKNHLNFTYRDNEVIIPHVNSAALSVFPPGALKCYIKEEKIIIKYFINTNENCRYRAMI